MAERESPYRWVVETLLFLTYFAFGISWMAYAPLLSDLERHFQASHAQVAMLISIVSVAKAFVPLLAGLLAACIGTLRALVAGAALTALAVVAPQASTLSQLLALRFLFGIGGAVVVTLTGAAVMEWFPKRELPIVNAVNNVAVNSGITVAMFAAVPLAATVGWQRALTLLGTACALLAMAWLILGREHPATPRAAAEHEKAFPQLLAVLRLRETWLIALAFSGPLSLYLALNTWLPTHYQTAFHMTRAAAAHATGIFNLVGIPTAILGGVLSARLGKRRPLIILSGALMPAAAICMVAAPAVEARTAAAVVLGAAFFLYVSPLFTIPMELPGITPQHIALLNGVVYSVAYLVSFLSPMMVGWLRDQTGSFTVGLVVAAVLSSSLALGGWLLPETGRRPTATPQPLAAAA